MSHLFGSPRLRRALGLIAVPALALSSLAALTSTPANAAEPDPAPAAAGAAWLEDQLTDGLVVNTAFGDPFNDYGLSIDIGLALDALGGHDATVDEISTALAEEIGAYVGDGDRRVLRRLARQGGRVRAEPRATTRRRSAAVDLVDRLESGCRDTGATLGRIQDASEFGDFANTFGQTFAVRALDEAGSTRDRLGHRLPARPAVRRRASSGRTSQRSTRPTRTVTTTRSPHRPPTSPRSPYSRCCRRPTTPTCRRPSTTRSPGWSTSRPRTARSAPARTSRPPNTNSTGLAGWALGEAGETAAAEKAAVFVRALQVDEPAAMRDAS